MHKCVGAIIAIAVVMCCIMLGCKFQRSASGTHSNVSKEEYELLKDHKRYLSGLFRAEYGGKRVKVHLVYMAYDQQRIVNMQYPGVGDRPVIFANDHNTFKAANAMQDKTTASFELQKSRLYVTLPESHKSIVFNMKEGQLITIYGRVMNYTHGSLIRCDKMVMGFE